jgi:predicted enzyme related to lactoylglutathione lyase
MSTAATPATGTTSITAPPYGRFVWYDLMTTDVAAATAFYSKLAGWGTQNMDMGPAGTYQMWTVGGVPIGGATKLTPAMGEGTPPHWMASVGVVNVDESARLAESLGGKLVTGPMDIPNVGRWAIISDPQGVVISLYMSATGTPPTDYAPQLGQFSWHELMTTDHKAAMEFYSRLFGWEQVSEFDMGPAGQYLMYGHRGPGGPPGATGIPYGGMMTMTEEMRAQMPACWVYYIKVPSADAAAELAKESGGTVVIPPMEVPGGDRIAQIMDPQGALFAVHSSKA